MATKKEREREEAVRVLKEWGLKDGTIVHAKVCKVSRSGMFRRVKLYMVGDNPEIDGGGGIIEISYWASKALEWSYKDGYEGGIGVGGCGMDMLFHTIDCLSYAMGYGSICQDWRDNTPKEKGGANGQKILAIGLRYKSL